MKVQEATQDKSNEGNRMPIGAIFQKSRPRYTFPKPIPQYEPSVHQLRP
jgi:hypothetical protein